MEIEVSEQMGKIIKEVLKSQIKYWEKELDKRKSCPSSSFSDFRIILAERKVKECKACLISWQEKTKLK